MPERNYCLVDYGSNAQAQKNVDEIKSLGLKHHQAGFVGNTAFLTGDFTSESVITVKNPKKPKRYDLTGFPAELQASVRKIATELNLAHKHVKTLKKELKILLAQCTEHEEKVSKILDRASELRRKSDLDNFMNRFRTLYTKFFALLSSEELYCLDDSDSQEVSTNLQLLKTRISEVNDKISK